ncbi:MAG TPA: gamma-glutamyltransferase, partial [bacterium]|nr:gamma-glutamyltransferase [bacterium]
MKRRNFLQAGIGLGMLSPTNWKTGIAMAKEASVPSNPDQPKITGAPTFIDRQLLRGRNRNRSTVACRHGVCCASQPLAASAGVDILKAGGNAIDAAIAIDAMLSLVEPMSCGPGGDLFAIAWIEKEQKLVGLNASGRSPFEWNREKAKEHG